MNLKIRLSIVNFLQFAVWGAYLTCMGNYLGKVGMGGDIAWFYAIQGIVSIFMPTIIGIIADKLIQPQRLLGICHFISGTSMLMLAYLGMNAAMNEAMPDKTLFMFIYSIGVAFYMPTLALSNSVAFTILKNNGYDTVKAFPPIRVMGTVGFILTMWFVNCATTTNGFGFSFGDDPNKFMYSYMQFFTSGVLGIIFFLYCFTLPQCLIIKTNEKKSLATLLGLDAFKLFKSKQMALFFIFSALLGMSLQITNSFATPFITSFKEIMPNSFAANNATILISVSQISEALCILLIPFFLRRFGIKIVMLIAMFAWVFRFGFFGLGTPEFPQVILFILSCIVYGVAFDFFNISGSLYVDKMCEPGIRSAGQGLFMLMTNGLGAAIGTLAAGAVINHYCQWNSNGYLQGEWSTCWYIFALYALIVGVLFAILFKEEKAKQS